MLPTLRTRLIRGALLALYMAVGVAMAARYVATGPLPADAGELQLVARELGVAHPPGYPLYTMSAHAFGRLIVPDTGLGLVAAQLLNPLLGGPCPELAARSRAAMPTEESPWLLRCTADPVAGWWSWSTNLFSLVLALLTLLVVFRAGRRLGGSWTTGLLAASVLLAMPVFVQQATTANIRMPTALLTATVLALALRWLDATHEGDPPPRVKGGLLAFAGDTRLHGLALALGLAASHHISLVFLAPLVVTILIIRRPWLLAPSQMQPLLLAGSIGLLPLLYLPIRGAAGALLAPPDLTTLGGFWRHVTGANFRGDLRLFDDPLALWDRTRVVFELLQLQIGWHGVLLVLLGSWWLMRRRWAVAWLLLGVLLTYVVLAVLYRAPQTVEYLMPAHVAVALLAAAAGGAIVTFREQALVSSPPLRRLAVIALALAIGASGRNTARDVRAAHPHDLAGIVDATTAEPDCTVPVLAGWHYVTPLWLGRLGSGEWRPYRYSDALYVYPEGSEPIGETWLRRTRALMAEAAAGSESVQETGSGSGPGTGGGAVIVTNRTRALLDSDVALWPVDGTPFYATAPDVCGFEAGLQADLDERNKPQWLPFLEPWAGIPTRYHGRIDWPDDDGPVFRAAPVAGSATQPAGVNDVAAAAVVTTDVDVAATADKRDPSARGAVRLVGADLPSAIALRDAARMPVGLRFQTIAPITADTTVVVQLVDPVSGAVHGQLDRGFSAARWNDARGVAVLGDLHAFRGPRPERLELRLGLYDIDDGETRRWNVDAGGIARSPILVRVEVRAVADPASVVLRVAAPTAGALDVESGEETRGESDGASVADSPEDRANRTSSATAGSNAAATLALDLALPAPRPGAIPFGDAMTLLGHTLRRSGNQLVVDLSWRAERAYRSDFTVSVQATAEGGFFAQHDGTPASGSYPTLKWLPGQRVWDRHRISLPPDWPRDRPIHVTVGVYDAFSLEPLPVTDAERVRDGQGQRATLYEAVLP